MAKQIMLTSTGLGTCLDSRLCRWSPALLGADLITCNTCGTTRSRPGDSRRGARKENRIR